MTHLRAFLLYTALAIALTYPLVAHLSTALPHDLGDPLLSTHILWWNAHHLPFTSRWWDGLAFYPERGSLAFSDHRVGLGVIATPVQWLGGTPILAHNLTFLLSFSLSALTAHVLTRWLTGSHAAGLVSGLVFGFNPYRMAHIPHLELLAAYWLPLALFALHRYRDEARPTWLMVVGGSCLLQGLSSGYYYFFFVPFLGLWMIWFVDGSRWKQQVVKIGASWLASLVLLLPVLVAYAHIHDRLGLSREFGEIQQYSADITGLLDASSDLALWKSPLSFHRSEGELFPGITAVAVVVIALCWRRGTRTSELERRPETSRGANLGSRGTRMGGWRALPILFLLVAGTYCGVALSTLRSSWAVHVLGVTVSASSPQKPLTVASAFLILSVLTSRRFLEAYRQRSAVVFYASAAVAMWLFALGPRPTFMGHAGLYMGPYAWLMALPGFASGLRVPGRFAMLMMLALAVAAGLAFDRLSHAAGRRARAGLAILVSVGILADCWPGVFPVYDAPRGYTIPEPARFKAVMELPLGDAYFDFAALYRSLFHGCPVVNGISGYEPPHYRVLKLGLTRHDDSVLTALSSVGPILVTVDESADANGEWTRYVEHHQGISRLPAMRDRAFFVLPATPSRYEPFDSNWIQGKVRHTVGLENINDRDPLRHWVTRGPQRGGEEIALELDTALRVHGVSLGLGPHAEDFPRQLSIETSIDGNRWTPGWEGETSGLALRGALQDPHDVRLLFPLSAAPARFIRLRQLAADLYGWSISEIAINGSPWVP